MPASPSSLTMTMLLVPVLLFSSSCESTNAISDKMMQNKEVILGGLAGTAVGGTIGALVGKKKGALIGGGVGLVSGALIGNYIAKQERTRTQTTATVGYRPEQGNLLTITDASAAPTVAMQGQDVQVGLKYTILRPEEGNAVVKETREVRWNGSLVDSQTAEISMDQGEQRITWKYPVSPDAPAGTYQVLTAATVEDKQAAAIVIFTVN